MLLFKPICHGEERSDEAISKNMRDMLKLPRYRS